MKQNERMNTLKNAGIEVGKYFSLVLPEGIKPGASVTVVINENGIPVFSKNKTDETISQIYANGYVKNTRLHRRWVMAQMFRMLNYKHTRYEGGFDSYLNHRYPYEYQFTMMKDEFFVLSKLEKSDAISFEERRVFFDKEVAVATCEDYIEKLKKHIESLPVKNCKGIPYKKIHGHNYFVVDIDKKVINPLRIRIIAINNSNNYKDLYYRLRMFMREMIKIPSDTQKCAVWKDAFKGAGAYYTLKNMIMFHNCYVVEPSTGVFLSREDSLRWIDLRRKEYKGEYWRLFALLKKVIKDNNFNFDQRMREVYSNK